MKIDMLDILTQSWWYKVVEKYFDQMAIEINGFNRGPFLQWVTWLIFFSFENLHFVQDRFKNVVLRFFWIWRRLESHTCMLGLPRICILSHNFCKVISCVRNIWHLTLIHWHSHTQSYTGTLTHTHTHTHWHTLTHTDPRTHRHTHVSRPRFGKYLVLLVNASLIHQYNPKQKKTNNINPNNKPSLNQVSTISAKNVSQNMRKLYISSYTFTTWYLCWVFCTFWAH